MSWNVLLQRAGVNCNQQDGFGQLSRSTLWSWDCLSSSINSPYFVAFSNALPKAVSPLLLCTERYRRKSSHSRRYIKWHPSPIRVVTVMLPLTLNLTTHARLGLAMRRQEGLAASDSSLHHLWTFGPTVILAIVAAVWARVEFQVKLTAPWIRMMTSKHPAKASKTSLNTYFDMYEINLKSLIFL